MRFWYGSTGSRVAIDLMACNSEFLQEAAWRAQPARVFGIQVAVATAEDVVLFKLASWRAKYIPDALAVFRRHGERLDLKYIERWARWLASANPCFASVPRRLESIVRGGPIPPPTEA